MYKIALCDNSIEYMHIVKSRIQNFCKENELNVILDTFEDSCKLAEYMEEKKGYDAYILDIEMPNVTGIELAEKIKEHVKRAYIIYLTASDKYAIEAYGINVLGYILKDHMEAVLDSVLRKLFKELECQTGEGIYVISNQRKYIKIPHNDIIYIYKDEKNVVFVLEGMKREQDRTTLQKVYKRLNNSDMYILDRGYIINLQHVRKIVADVVKMKGGHDLITNIAHASQLREHMKQYGRFMV